MILTREEKFNYQGVDHTSFSLHFDEELPVGSIITYDKVYGQRLKVLDSNLTEEGDYKTKLNLISKDKQEWLLSSNVVKGKEYFIL